MSAALMYGKPVVDAMIEKMNGENTSPGLAVVQVGHNPESGSYVKQLEKTIGRIPSLRYFPIFLHQDTTLSELRAILMDLNHNREVSGYMIQLPLPDHLKGDMHEVRELIDPLKDVDLIGPHQRGNVFEKKEGQLVPPTGYGVIKILNHYVGTVKGKVMTVLGDGQVGKLLKVMAGNDGATYIACNEFTPEGFTSLALRNADIVVAACQQPDMLTGDMIKPGAVIVNVGLHYVDGKPRGDVDVDSVMPYASLVTPVSGGSGPVTVAALTQNTFRAEKIQQLKRSGH